MPSLTNVIDDKSPLIMYDSTWLPGTAWDDSLATDYYLGTFTTNNVTDGSVTFDFNGTAVWIYGANRPNHGSYTVQIDSQTYPSFNGAGNNLFQQSIFNTSLLGQSLHTLKLTNTASGSLYVDIDMIVWQSQVGNTDDQLIGEVVQDTDPRFQYEGPAWSTTSSTLNFGLFSNGTGHVTGTYEANVTLMFTGMLVVYVMRHYTPPTCLSGEAVSLFGTSGPYNGPYSAQLDGGTTVQYNATNAYPNNYGVMIYHADNLGPGFHELVLTNLPAASGQYLSIDYAQLWALVGADSTGSPNPSSDNATRSNISSGAIAGIVVPAVAAVLFAGAALFFYRRWKAAMVVQQDLYRTYITQRRPLPSTAAALTGYSSSLETRSNGSLLRNNVPQQPVNIRETQLDGAGPMGSSLRDSRSIYPPSSPSQTQAPADEALERRPLPEAPGGGQLLSDEFPKLAHGAGQRRQGGGPAADHASIVASEVPPPPNYTQATWNAHTTHI